MLLPKQPDAPKRGVLVLGFRDLSEAVESFRLEEHVSQSQRAPSSARTLSKDLIEPSGKQMSAPLP